jgi:hypothetical protein
MKPLTKLLIILLFIQLSAMARADENMENDTLPKKALIISISSHISGIYYT